MVEVDSPRVKLDEERTLDILKGRGIFDLVETKPPMIRRFME